MNIPRIQSVSEYAAIESAYRSRDRETIERSDEYILYVKRRKKEKKREIVEEERKRGGRNPKVSIARSAFVFHFGKIISCITDTPHIRR